MIELMNKINIMIFPDEIIWTNKQTSQIVPLHNIVRGPIEPTIPQLESWAVSDNGASKAFNMYEANDILTQHGIDPWVRHEYIGNLQHVSTDIMRMHIELEFWYQQHTFDSDAYHLNNNMIDMVQMYMRGDATRMETYINLGAVVNEFEHCKGNLPGAN
jgi:hypothetical protein